MPSTNACNIIVVANFVEKGIVCQSLNTIEFANSPRNNIIMFQLEIKLTSTNMTAIR